MKSGSNALSIVHVMLSFMLETETEVILQACQIRKQMTKRDYIDSSNEKP